MTLKQYLFIMFLATVFCWVAWFMVIFNVDPTQSDSVGFWCFYTSFFCALVGTFSILTFLGRWFFSKSDDPVFRFVKRSFRDGFLISFFIITTLYLQAQSYLHLWNLTALAGAIVLYVLLTYSIDIFKNNQKDTQI